MTRKILPPFLALCFLSLLFGCNHKEKTAIEQPSRRNMIILLDLSDRLIANQNQVQYDKELISYILSGYIKSIRDTVIKFKRDFTKVKDRFQIFIADQKDAPYDRYNYENLLRFDLSDQSSSNLSDVFNKFSGKASGVLDDLYSKAVYSTNPKDYKGADLWKFFSEDLPTIISNEPGARNYLFILTDGYINFEDYNGRVASKNRFSSCSFMSQLRSKDWEQIFDRDDYGLIPVGKNFDNLEVMVLEVNPADFWNEFNLLNKIWGKWFNEMSIRRYKLAKIENLGKTKNDIDQFMKD